MRRALMCVGFTLAGCGSSYRFDVTIYGHGTVTLHTATVVCEDAECRETIELPAEGLPVEIDLRAQATDLDWVLTSLTSDEVQEAAATESLGHEIIPADLSIKAEFLPLESCIPNADLGGPPNIDPISTVCATVDRISITGDHLAATARTGQPDTCVYINTRLVGTTNAAGPAGGDVTSVDILVPDDLAAGGIVIVVRTRQGRAMRSMGFVDWPDPDPRSISPNPTSGETIGLITGANFRDPMIAELRGPVVLGNLWVQPNSSSAAQLLVPDLQPGDYNLTLSHVCGQGTMPGFLTIQ